MAQATEKLAVLFADISGSTALYEKLGDDLARRLIAQCIKNICTEIPKQQGTLIKTLGDEVMCTFPDTACAFHAARAMQHAVAYSTYEGGHKMAARIGFHYGEVIREASDVFGDTVNVAARVTAITRANQIMTSLAAVENLPLALRANIRQVMRAEFKGKQERLDIFVVSWEPDDGAITRTDIPAYRNLHASDELKMTGLGQTVVVNKTRRIVTMGRDKSRDLVVRSNLSSRRHASIELRFDKFVLIDQSTNGTYVYSDDGEVIYLLHEEMILHGSGSISLCKTSMSNRNELIEYVVSANNYEA